MIFTGKYGCGRAVLLAFLLVFIACSAFMLPKADAHSVADNNQPRVAVSIMPLHSLVSAVMEEVGEPSLIVHGSGSEHGYQLRPQDAKNLENADIVFWAGRQMETFLQKPLQNLSNRARIIALVDAPGMVLLPMRAGGIFKPQMPDARATGVPEFGKSLKDSGGDTIAADAAEKNAVTAEHAENMDLHFWLDPQNAQFAVAYIANILAEQDPQRAALYHHNAELYRQKLQALTERVNAELSPVRNRPFIVFHDAYQYFERRFSIPALGAVTINPELQPGAKRIAVLRRQIQAFFRDNEGARAKSDADNVHATERFICVFTEPQFSPNLLQSLTEGTNSKTGVLDPLGSMLQPGSGQYIQLIQNMADSLRQCLQST